MTDGTPGVARYRKKPVEVDAIQWTGENFDAVKAFASGAVGIGTVMGGAIPLWVTAAAATCYVERGDWIIREPDGSGFYPVTDDPFSVIYEPADTATPLGAALDRGRLLALIGHQTGLYGLPAENLADAICKLVQNGSGTDAGTVEAVRHLNAADAEIARLRERCAERGRLISALIAEHPVELGRFAKLLRDAAQTGSEEEGGNG